jgi:hypothetical protein
MSEFEFCRTHKSIKAEQFPVTGDPPFELYLVQAGTQKDNHTPNG